MEISVMLNNWYENRKVTKDTKAFNSTVNQFDLFDIYRKFYPKKIEFTLFSSACGTFIKMNYIFPNWLTYRLAHKLHMVFPWHEIPFPAYASPPTWLILIHLSNLFSHYLLYGAFFNYSKEILSLLYDCIMLYIHSYLFVSQYVRYMYSFFCSYYITKTEFRIKITVL